MITIFLVVGTTGEYSDRTEWFVRAYRSKDRAESLARLAQARGVELSEWIAVSGESKPKNEFDPQFDTDYTGTDYYVTEVSLDDD